MFTFTIMVAFGLAAYKVLSDQKQDVSDEVLRKYRNQDLLVGTYFYYYILVILVGPITTHTVILHVLLFFVPFFNWAKHLFGPVEKFYKNKGGYYNSARYFVSKLLLGPQIHCCRSLSPQKFPYY